MATDRLTQVHQAELTESRLNADFVDFLKGPFWTYLLVVLVVVAGWLAWFKWRQQRQHTATQAWTALAQTNLPSSMEDLVQEYSDVAGFAVAARQRAAATLLEAVQIDRPLGAASNLTTNTPQTEPAALSPQERSDYLLRADRLFREILEADDGSLAFTLHAVSALAGRAVVAECGQDAQQATRFFDQAATRAEKYYPALAERYRRRATEAPSFSVAPVTLPRQADLPARVPLSTGLEPVAIDDVLRPLVLPK